VGGPHGVRRRDGTPQRSSEFDWSSDDGPGPEEKAVEHSALVESFETLKKVKDAANDRFH
jgi:hypothetical protein